MKYFIAILVSLIVSNIAWSAERIPGTKISLDAPADFEAATQFPGFMMQSTGASILVMEIPGPFSEVSKGFTKEALAPRGISLLEKSDVKIGSNDALLFKLKQPANGLVYLKWAVAMGTESESVMVTATFPEQFEEELSDLLKAAVLAVEWDASLEVDIFEGLSFRIEEKGDLKIANKIGNALLITRGGVTQPEDKAAPSVIVGSSLTEDVILPEDQRKDFAQKRLSQIGIIPQHEITTEKELVVDDLPGILLEAEGKDKDGVEDLYLMQCLLFSEDGYYIFIGSVRVTEKEKYAPIFLSMLNSFSQS